MRHAFLPEEEDALAQGGMLQRAEVWVLAPQSLRVLARLGDQRHIGQLGHLLGEAVLVHTPSDSIMAINGRRYQVS